MIFEFPIKIIKTFPYVGVSGQNKSDWKIRIGYVLKSADVGTLFSRRNSENSSHTHAHTHAHPRTPKDLFQKAINEWKLLTVLEQF